MKPPFVYIKFPRTGLGNMLHVWARGFYFAHLNDLPCITTPRYGIQWGALIRMEKKSRFYLGYFRESPIFKRLGAARFIRSAEVIAEPELMKVSGNLKKENKVFIFSKVIANQDFFLAFRGNELLIKTELYNTVSQHLLKKMKSYPVPEMSLHIRRGDFKLGSTITPISFFYEAVLSVRKILQDEIPVTIFTDADANEISELLQLPSVTVAETKPDILDILLMGKSRVIAISSTSSFSYWGAFLSNATVIRPDGDWLLKIKDENKAGYREVYPGAFDEKGMHLLTDALHNQFAEANNQRAVLKADILH